MKPTRTKTRHLRKTPQQVEILEDMWGAGMMGWGSAYQATIETAMVRTGLPMALVTVSYFYFGMPCINIIICTEMD